MFLAIKLVDARASSDPANLKDLSTADAYCYQIRDSRIWLKKRAGYPVTFARQNSEVLSFGYGERADNPGEQAIDEFLNCTLDGSQGTFHLERDAYCTLPLFCYAGSGVCLISDDLEWIVSKCHELTLDKAALADLLARPNIAEKTLFAEVQLLTERTGLQWAAGQLAIKQLPVKPPAVANAEPADFKAKLESTLDRYWQLTERETAAFEVSGGIDSATMPLYIAKRYPDSGVRTGGMNFIESFGTTQAQKLQDLSDCTDSPATLSSIDKQIDYPLARFFNPEFKPAAFYQYQEIYTEALSRLAASFRDQGISVVFTGIGGDELFEGDDGDTAQQPKLPDYCTSHARSELNTAKPLSNIRVMSNSAFYANQSRNKLYIDNGIWPIAPLSDPHLLAYCRKLGPVYRSNKNILRAYHEAAGFPESISRPVQNEHFGRFFEDSIKENYDGVLKMLKQHSVLAKQGFVNWQQLMDVYDAARWRENGGADLFAIFRLATAEVILQAATAKLR